MLVLSWPPTGRCWYQQAHGVEQGCSSKARLVTSDTAAGMLQYVCACALCPYSELQPHPYLKSHLQAHQFDPARWQKLPLGESRRGRSAAWSTHKSRSFRTGRCIALNLLYERFGIMAASRTGANHVGKVTCFLHARIKNPQRIFHSPARTYRRLQKPGSSDIGLVQMSFQLQSHPLNSPPSKMSSGQVDNRTTAASWHCSWQRLMSKRVKPDTRPTGNAAAQCKCGPGGASVGALPGSLDPFRGRLRYLVQLGMKLPTRPNAKARGTLACRACHSTCLSLLSPARVLR